MKVVIPDYPPIKLYYFSGKYFNSGVKVVNVEGNDIKIFEC